MRTATHTVILDRGPEFEDFRRAEDGVVPRLVRVWLPRGEGGEATPAAYLGSVVASGSDEPSRELAKLLRRLTRSLAERRAPARGRRRTLVKLVRGFARGA